MGTEALLARSRTDGLGSLVIRIAGAEKCRLRNSVDQIEPAHSGHMLVDDKTATGRQVACAQQLGSRCVATDRETLDLEREFQGIANRKIIVQDDHHEPRSRQFAVRCHRLCPRWRLHEAVRKQEDRDAALIWLNLRPGRRSTSTPVRRRHEVFGRSESGPRIPAIRAMRTRSDRLAACILVMRFAR